MFMSRQAALATAIALLLPIQAAADFRSINRQIVNPVSDTVFEVVGSPGARPETYWCAAGDYAQRKLGLPWQTRLYIASPRGQSVTTNRRTAVRFTFDPVANGIQPTDKTVNIFNLQVGLSRTVTGARGACEDDRMRLSDR